jgi:hypothetical protein
MTEKPERPGSGARRFRVTLVSVLTVQVCTLILLWLLQRTYTP